MSRNYSGTEYCRSPFRASRSVINMDVMLINVNYFFPNLDSRKGMTLTFFVIFLNLNFRKGGPLFFSSSNIEIFIKIYFLYKIILILL